MKIPNQLGDYYKELFYRTLFELTKLNYITVSFLY